MVVRQPGQLFDEEVKSGVDAEGNILPGRLIFCNVCLMTFKDQNSIKQHLINAHNWKGEDLNNGIRRF